MLGQLIAKVFTGEAGVFIARMRRVALLGLLVALFAIVMIGFLVGAAFVWVADSYGGFWASIIFAIICLVIVLLLLVGLVIARRPPKQRASDRLQRDIASIASVAALTNAPTIFRSVRRRRSLLLVPAAGGLLWAILRAINAFRDRR